jgi:hypothetical protein
MKKYEIVRNLPVARFYYAGSHSHPIRRTVLVTENHRTYFKGYELREGNVVRTATTKAPVKTYSKKSIARIGQCGRRLRERVPVAYHTNTTFERQRLVDLVHAGI